jgi:ribosomal-protein-alanine N-acetyltransferase
MQFHTDRLIATPPCADDLDDLVRMHRDPSVMALLGGMRSEVETQDFLRDAVTHWSRHGFGLWMFRSRADAQFVGRGGLRNVQVAGRTEVELAYALMPSFWGRGLATEIATSVLARAFELLDFADIVAFTLPTNLASRRVMEKIGFAFERDIVHAGLPHVLYRIQREQFESGRMR